MVSITKVDLVLLLAEMVQEWQNPDKFEQKRQLDGQKWQLKSFYKFGSLADKILADSTQLRQVPHYYC